MFLTGKAWTYKCYYWNSEEELLLLYNFIHSALSVHSGWYFWHKGNWCNTPFSALIFIILVYFNWLFFERGRDVRAKHQSVASCTHYTWNSWDQDYNLDMYLDQETNQWPLGALVDTLPLSNTGWTLSLF